MRERLTVGLGALLSLALLYAVFFPGNGDNPRTSRPLSTEAGPGGYLGLQRWLAQEGVPTISVRERFDVLNDRKNPAYGPGNVLIMTMPQLRHPHEQELWELNEWITGGNTLVLLAGLNDTPAWSYAGDSGFFHKDLERITKSTFTDTNDMVPKKATQFTVLPAPLPIAIRPSHRHWLMQGVGSLVALTDLPTAKWQVESGSQRRPYAIASASDDGRAVLWLQAVGDGQIITSSYASLFDNAVIGRADNRKLVVNIMHFYLGRHGRVLFDDMHQGLSTLYDPDAFFADPRLHNSLYLLLALWLICVLFTGKRLGGVPAEQRPPRAADFVRATGRFLAQKVEGNEAARRMFANLFERLRRRIGLPADESGALDQIAASPLADPVLVARLRTAWLRVSAGKHVDLVLLQNQMSQLMRAFH